MQIKMERSIGLTYYMAGKEINIPGRDPYMIEPMLLQKGMKVTINKIQSWVNDIEYIYESIPEETGYWYKLEVRVHLTNC